LSELSIDFASQNQWKVRSKLSFAAEGGGILFTQPQKNMHEIILCLTKKQQIPL
jgi:hypothetical protein